MRGLRKVAVLAVASVVVFGMPPVLGQNATSSTVPHGPVNWLPDHNQTGQFCRYPGPNLKRAATVAHATLRATQITEVEPNDQFSNAQVLTLSPTPANPIDVDVNGTINIGADVDLYRFSSKKGDIYGLAVLAQSSVDPVVAVQDVSQTSLIENDNWNGAALYYPASSPWPVGVGIYDSALTWVCPADGDYLIRVTSFASASRGNYTLQIRARRPSFESQNVGSTQIVFLDFDGATIDAQQTFSYPYAWNPATLSPLRDFLPRWGLTAQDEAAVVQAIIDRVQEITDTLRQASLNGNLKTDKTLGHYDIQILNSRDHGDPWGQPNVSRVIIGGTIDQLGIPTIGIASTIDPGNFSHEDTAVVLLDYLSAPAGDPNSVNSIGLASGVTTIDAIGQTVGIVAAHEMGHYLGNWHTDNADEIPCVMDTGGNYIWIAIGAGPDATLGTSDDVPIEFVVDVFDPFEGIAVGDETTDVNTAFSLATGRIARVQPPDPAAAPTYPLASIRATPSSGSPPLTVEFSAGAIDNATDVIFIWDFADGTSDTGPLVSHVFQNPGDFLVKVTATNSQDATGTATVLITVKAALPTAVIAASPTHGPAPLAVKFDGSGSTTASASITPFKYEWDFGDSTTGVDAVVSHTYASPGYYAAKLTFTDSNGGTSTATTLITVTGSSTSTSLDAAQTTPTTTPSSSQCGAGGGVMMIGSFTGLFAMMIVRRRH